MIFDCDFSPLFYFSKPLLKTSLITLEKLIVLCAFFIKFACLILNFLLRSSSSIIVIRTIFSEKYRFTLLYRRCFLKFEHHQQNYRTVDYYNNYRDALRPYYYNVICFELEFNKIPIQIDLKHNHSINLQYSILSIFFRF